jgi:type II secretory pathway pseudopilin PulG
MKRLRRIAASESGYTVIELLQVMGILSLVVAALTTVFVNAMNAEVDMNRRFSAQQEARLAVDKLRREVHCARVVSPTGPSASVTVTLPGNCPSAGGAEITVTYATQLVGTSRYQLRRNGVPVADYITEASVFEYTPQSPSSLARLRVSLPVNTNPTDAGKTWRLVADAVLRNSKRS